MEKKNVVKDIEIIREGMDGTHMYILEKGQVQVSKGHGVEKEFVCDLGEGKFKHPVDFRLIPVILGSLFQHIWMPILYM